MVHRESFLREVQLHHLWFHRLFRQEGLRTERGVSIQVLFPGFPTGEGGPDFLSARILLDGIQRVGDIEVHRTPRDWHAHGHGIDAAYDGVILHVVLDRDGSELPGEVLVLRPHLEYSTLDLLRGLGPVLSVTPASRSLSEAREFLEAAGRVRWARRRRRHARMAERIGGEEAAHRALFVALGYHRNRGPFEELSRLVPAADVIGMDETSILNRLNVAARGVAVWRSHAVRPHQRPRRQLEVAARWLARGSALAQFQDLLSGVHSLRSFHGAVRSFVERTEVAPDRARRILLHAGGCVIPESQALTLLALHPPLSGNRREREGFQLTGHSPVTAPRSVLMQMGALEVVDLFRTHGSGPAAGFDLATWGGG